MAYEIHTDWLWKQSSKPRKRRESIYPFQKMRPGQYFNVPYTDVKDKQTLYNKINQVAMRLGIKFKIQPQYEEAGIWNYRVYHDGYAE